MSPQQSFPSWCRVPVVPQDWPIACTKYNTMHNKEVKMRSVSTKLFSASLAANRVLRGITVKYYAMFRLGHPSRSYWSSSYLHGSPPTYRLGLPPDKDAGCPSLLNLPAGRGDPPDKELIYTCMNGSPGDPPGTVVHQSKHKMNRPFNNPSRGRSVRQGGRAGDNYRRYQICH